MYRFPCYHFKWLVVIVDSNVPSVDVCAESFQNQKLQINILFQYLHSVF